MYQKTDQSEFAPGFIWQLLALTIIAFALVLFLGHVMPPDNRTFVSNQVPLMAPWMLAGGKTIENGLRSFAGHPAETVSAQLLVRSLIGFLIIGVVCPAVFLLRWRRRKISAASEGSVSPWRTSDVLTGLCTAVTVFFIATSVPFAIYAQITGEKLRNAHALQTNRDAIITDVNMIGVKAAEYYILPKELGGGNRSCEGFALPPELTKNENGVYTVVAHKASVDIEARSVRYPAASINVTADSAGRLGRWEYGGLFQ